MRRENTEVHSYEDLYRLEYQVIYRYIKHVIRNDDYTVEDLTQEVFLVAFQKWESDVCKHPNVNGFLFAVAHNKLKKYFERGCRNYVDDTTVIDFLETTTAKLGRMDEYERVEFFATLEKVLSVEEMDLLRYYYEYDYTSAEMAKIMNVSESCFRMRMTRMRNKLKKYFSGLYALLLCIACWF